MTINLQKLRDLLNQFNFSELFIELGWKSCSQKKIPLEIENKRYEYKRIAEISGVVVFEITAADSVIPNAKTRAAIYEKIKILVAENLLIFVDKEIEEERNHSLWYWVKLEGNKRYDHEYIKGQAEDLFLSKIASLFYDLSDLEYGEPSVIETVEKLRKAFDIEKVTKKFYKEFQELHKQFLQYVEGIDNLADRRWYTSIILNRLMFVYFLQRKGFIDNEDTYYLQNKLDTSKEQGENHFYNKFLQALFFESFAKPEQDRDKSVESLVGKVKYLNGGLFLEHPIEQNYKISIADEAFEQVFNLFERYSWNLNDTSGADGDEINPDVLGYIFEKYINQKEKGAYYTRKEITEYLCDRTIDELILERVNTALLSPPFSNLGRYSRFLDIKELCFKLDANLCELLIDDETGILTNLSILDPACGSGAFLLAAMRKLYNLYFAVITAIDKNGNRKLKKWLNDIRRSNNSLAYFVRKQIITNNLYGVDIMEEATEIARLRMFLALVASAQEIDQLEPLPNIDFNIMSGNSLIGLMQVKESDYDSRYGQLGLFNKNYKQLVNEKNSLLQKYRTSTSCDVDLQGLREEINQKRAEAQQNLDEILYEVFKSLKIKYKKASVTGKGKGQTLPLKFQYIKDLKAFHWGYEFNEIIQDSNGNPGFDIILTNPPWEIFKPQAKEFFAQYSDLVTKNKMDIKTFEKQQKKLLANPEIAEAWLEYQSQYPYVSAYYRSSEDYKNQISRVNGKKQGTDINLYKLFLERCFHLLRDKGECGIVIPSGIYTDLGTKQLREMLFSQTKVTGLFCLENRKAVFEGVDSRFKIVVLTFEKNGTTKDFPSAFMRLDVNELQRFPSAESLRIDVDMVRKLSPESLSVMEFKNEVDIRIAQKMLKFPLLGEKIEGKWNLSLKQEFNMTSDSHLFQQQPGKGKLPLYEGKMIHQFTHQYAEPRYWIDEKEGRKAVLGKKGIDSGQKLDYQSYRLGFRDVASSTNERTMIAAIIPPKIFVGNTLIVSYQLIKLDELLFTICLLNSFVCDFVIRQKVTAHCNMFYIYQTPLPRLTEGDRNFTEIVQRAAKLICTAPEFDELAQEVGLDSHKNGITDETQRAQLRAELDGIIAHLYGLTEEEFKYILTTFPIVPEETKQAALKAYQNFTPISGDAEIVTRIKQFDQL